MSDNDTIDVIDALNGSLGEVSMHATAHEIVAAGRTRRRRRRLAGAATGVAGVAALALAVTYGHPSAAPDVSAGRSAGGGAVAGVHIHAAAFAVDSQSDGTVRVTWDKSRYFTDHAALEAALHQAGFPVTMRVGEFCTGPGDDPTLNQSGVGPGVNQVMQGESGGTGRVTFVFTPSAMPAGKQLFIGYLSDAQQASRHDGIGSVERLVSATAPLTCTTTPPPQSAPRADAGTDANAPAKGGQK